MRGLSPFGKKNGYFPSIHCILVESTAVVRWTSSFVILGVSGLFVAFILFLMKILLANNVEPSQTPHNVWHCFASDPFTGFQARIG